MTLAEPENLIRALEHAKHANNAVVVGQYVKEIVATELKVVSEILSSASPEKPIVAENVAPVLICARTVQAAGIPYMVEAYRLYEAAYNLTVAEHKAKENSFLPALMKKAFLGRTQTAQQIANPTLRYRCLQATVLAGDNNMDIRDSTYTIAQLWLLEAHKLLQSERQKEGLDKTKPPARQAPAARTFGLAVAEI